MIDALIAGKLYGIPEQRTDKGGKPFTVAKVLAAVGGDDQAVIVNVLAFDEAVQAALLALDDGCTVALSGSVTPKAWVDKNGKTRPSLDLIAAQVLTPYHVKRRRAAMAGGEAP